MTSHVENVEDNEMSGGVSGCGFFSEDYRAALDNSNVPIYIIDPESFQLLYCNRTLCRNMGADPTGKICYREFMKLDEPCAGCVAMQSVREGESKPAEVYFPMGFWGLLHSSRLSWNGRSLVQITCVDITERKEAEAELRLRNKEYAAVVRQSTSGIMRYDIDSDTAVVNVDKGLNRVEEYLIPDYVNVICNSGLIEEDSIPAARAMYDDIRRGVPSKGYELQLFLKEGEMRWCHLDYALIENDEGRPYRAVISFFDNTEQWERELLARSAKKDIMTGVYNHAAVENLIKEALAQDSGEQCCLLIIDLDDLRDINSALGHPEGDRALKGIAGCMTAQFGNGSILGRIGGDEFVALLHNVENTEQLEDSVHAFMKRLEEVKIGPLDDRAIHVSVGGALGTVGDADFKTLYERADLAMYYTKAMGKNAFNLYRPELEKREFIYNPRSEASLAKLESFDPTEFRKLLQAVSAYFPMVISVNLTQNTYYMMEYMAYAMQRHQDKGNFDQLIIDGANSFHPEDRAGFVSSFSRENLLQAYARGERMVRHVGRQLGDDGIYREAQGVVVFVQDESTDDICEITFSHMSMEETPILDKDGRDSVV